MAISFIQGDLFTTDAELILHQVNCRGVMGSGVALGVRQQYPQVFEAYSALCAIHKPTPAELLGTVQFCDIGGGQMVVNLFAQKDFGYDGKCYTDYDALRTALCKVAGYARRQQLTVALPYRMACHRGGGDWSVVSAIIEEEFADVDVLIYALQPEK